VDAVPFIALAQATVEWVEERYGTIAGWIVAVLMILAPFVVLAGIIAAVINFR
jgi:hypothetical protein